MGGELCAMVGGEDEDVELAWEFIETFTKKREHVGPLGAGMAVKSVNNILNTAHLMLATEGLISLTKAGISPEKALQVINSSSGSSLQTQKRLPEEVLTRNFAYGFKLDLMKKDCQQASQFITDMFPGATLLPDVARKITEIDGKYTKDSNGVDY